MTSGQGERRRSGPARSPVPTRVIVEPAGPIFIDGPVQLSVAGQEPLYVERFLVAICTCRASRAFPLCDGSHRRLAAQRAAVELASESEQG
ncbi:MAG: CDGSH iron-sulfur domain-containing protein [Sporichthyaceae bacterium]